VLKLVQEQAFVMDKKMAELQRENTELKKLLDEQGQTRHTDSFAMLPSMQTREHSGSVSSRRAEDMQSYSASIDMELVEAFSKAEKSETSENYRGLLVALAKRLMHEHQQRQLTEQQTELMIEQEHKSIRALVRHT
jgi:hypothetical protein